MLELIITYILTIILTFILACMLGVRFFSSIVLSFLIGIISYILSSPGELANFSDDKCKAASDIIIFTITISILLFYVILCILTDVDMKKYHLKIK